MAIIDPDGFYNGDRMAQLSDTARLHWPHLFLLCNGHGRFEINFRRILDRAYGAFQVRPTEVELTEFLREYHEAHLLFLYEFNGQAWGQWDTSEKFLPRHKTAQDMRTPAPCAKELSEWKNEYAQRKCAKRVDITFLSTVFANRAENSGKPAEDFGKVVRGVGVGVGVGVGKTIAQNSVSRDSDAHSLRAEETTLIQTQTRWFIQFWDRYWVKKDKKRALEKFKGAVKTQAIFDAVMCGVKAQFPEMSAREPQHRPHASTWLHGERWNDEATTPSRSIQSGHAGTQRQQSGNPDLRLTPEERDRARALFGAEDSE